MLNIESPRGLSPVGIGLIVIAVVLPVLALAVAGTLLWPQATRFPRHPNAVLVLIGWIWLMLGVVFWILTMRKFLDGFKRGELVTGGTFAWCRNPLYASLTVFVLPAIGLIAKAWPFFLVAVVTAIVLHFLLPSEEREMMKAFGGEWEAYASRTSRLLPLPPRGRWIRRVAVLVWIGFALVIALIAGSGAF
jgi:protein-S-isoprenylcysteine O-methyltransferase Ste14